MLHPIHSLAAAVPWPRRDRLGYAVARTFWFALISSSLRRTIEGPSPVLAEASASRARRSHYISKDTCAGTVELMMTYECGFLLKHLLHGTPATTGPVSTICTHTYKLLAQSPPAHHRDRSWDRHELGRLRGLPGSPEVFKIEAGGLLRVTLDHRQRPSPAAPLGPELHHFAGSPVLHSQAAAAAWNAGSIYSKSAEFTIDNRRAHAARQLNSAEPARPTS